MASYPSVLQQILRKHGRRALAALSGRLPVAVWEAARDALERMMACRTPEGGFVRLRCDSCGHLKTIAFSCKSRLCPSCGWLHAQRFVESVQARIIQCRYRHLVFSVPRGLREVLFWHRRLLPLTCHAAVAATLECFQGLCRRHRLVPGMVATCHTFGRNLRFHVHVHLLVTEGALQIGGVWQPVGFLPAREYRKRWQYHLLTKLRKALPTDPAAQRMVGQLFRKYPTGFIVNVESRYPSARQALSYCCRYLARPPPASDGSSVAMGGRSRSSTRTTRPVARNKRTVGQNASCSCRCSTSCPATPATSATTGSTDLKPGGAGSTKHGAPVDTPRRLAASSSDRSHGANAP